MIKPSEDITQSIVEPFGNLYLTKIDNENGLPSGPISLPNPKYEIKALGDTQVRAVVGNNLIRHVSPQIQKEIESIKNSEVIRLQNETYKPKDENELPVRAIILRFTPSQTEKLFELFLQHFNMKGVNETYTTVKALENVIRNLIIERCDALRIPIKDHKHRKFYIRVKNTVFETNPNYLQSIREMLEQLYKHVDRNDPKIQNQLRDIETQFEHIKSLQNSDRLTSDFMSQVNDQMNDMFTKIQGMIQNIKRHSNQKISEEESEESEESEEEAEEDRLFEQDKQVYLNNLNQKEINAFNAKPIQLQKQLINLTKLSQKSKSKSK